MSQSSAWIATEKQYYAQTVRRQPVVLVRGQGCRVWDADGKEYLDLWLDPINEIEETLNLRM